jgi:hypothetical protein
LERVRATLSQEAVPLSMVRKFARKANDYKPAYMCLIEERGPEMAQSYAEIESKRKLLASHRRADSAR